MYTTDLNRSYKPVMAMIVYQREETEIFVDSPVADDIDNITDANVKKLEEDIIIKEGDRMTAKVDADTTAIKPEVQAALNKRKSGQELTPEEQVLIDNFHKKRNNVSTASRDIGELGAESAMKQKHPDFDMVHGGVDAPNTAGTFDQIYVKQGPPKEFIIVEAKGGSADLGSANVKLGDEIKRAEQGTQAYRDHIINKMINSNDPDIKRLGREMRRAGRSNDIRYLMAQTPINRDGKAIGTILTEFE